MGHLSISIRAIYTMAMSNIQSVMYHSGFFFKNNQPNFFLGSKLSFLRPRIGSRQDLQGTPQYFGLQIVISGFTFPNKPYWIKIICGSQIASFSIAKS